MPGHIFVAIDPSANASIELDIREHDEHTHNYLKGICDKMSQALKNFHSITERNSCPGWAQWKVIEWSQAQIPERQKFGAWVGDVLAGYLWLRSGFQSAHDATKRIIYVEIMAAVPGNILTEIWGRQLTHVGLALLAFTVQQSISQSFEGRFGLHAADEAAAKYYRHLNKERGNSLFEDEQLGVIGVPPRQEQAKERPYFEAKLDGALELLQDYFDG